MRLASIILAIALMVTTSAFGHAKKKAPPPAPVQQEFEDPDWEQRDDITVIHKDYGGPLARHMFRYNVLKRMGTKIAIDGPCLSACTMFMGYFMPKDICVSENAVLGFHRGNVPEATIILFMKYPELVLQWIATIGLTKEIQTMPPELMHALWQSCEKTFLKPKPEGEKVD